MKKIGIYLCALWACGLMACSDDNEIGYVEPWEDEYVLPQGKSDADDRIVAFYEQYNRYILYDYTYLDIRYELKNYMRNYDFLCETLESLPLHVCYDLIIRPFRQFINGLIAQYRK